MKNKIPLKRKTATRVYSDNGKTCVQYHNTIVIKWDENSITLDSGGWKTKTTKERINQASDTHELGIGVFQRKFEWFVIFRNPEYLTAPGQVPYWLSQEVPFEDGMTFIRKHFGRSVVPFLPIVGVSTLETRKEA